MKNLSGFEKLMLQISSYIGAIIAYESFKLLLFDNFDVFNFGKFLLALWFTVFPFVNDWYIKAQKKHWKNMQNK